IGVSNISNMQADGFDALFEAGEGLVSSAGGANRDIVDPHLARKREILIGEIRRDLERNLDSRRERPKRPFYSGGGRCRRAERGEARLNENPAGSRHGRDYTRAKTRCILILMNVELVRRLCLSFQGAMETVQWGNNLVFKIAGKIFAIAALEPGDRWLSFKCSPEDFAELIERPGIAPAPYLARAS